MKWDIRDDGKVVDGRVVVFLRRAETPPASADAGAPAADEADEAQADPRVRNLRWGAGDVLHGDEAEMLADVDEGVTAFFTLERRLGKGPWQSLGSVKATVSAGTARATIRLEHPGNLDDARFRFRVHLL
jgi:hypothetical protein